jgi:hypothetical protein
VSCRVLVIPEDPTYNGALLSPLMERIVEQCGRRNPKITVLTNPALRGIDDVRKNIGAIADRYRHFDLLISVVEADGKDRRDLFANMKAQAAARGAVLVCAAAVQEVEIWLLAGHAEKLDIPWQNIRADVSVKENVFKPFLARSGYPRRPGGGRDLLMREALANLPGMLARCPELALLQTEIEAALAK